MYSNSALLVFLCSFIISALWIWCRPIDKAQILRKRDTLEMYGQRTLVVTAVVSLCLTISAASVRYDMMKKEMFALESMSAMQSVSSKQEYQAYVNSPLSGSANFLLIDEEDVRDTSMLHNDFYKSLSGEDTPLVRDPSDDIDKLKRADSLLVVINGVSLSLAYIFSFILTISVVQVFRQKKNKGKKLIDVTDIYSFHFLNYFWIAAILSIGLVMIF